MEMGFSHKMRLSLTAILLCLFMLLLTLNDGRNTITVHAKGNDTSDYTKPTLNAAVSNGTLKVTAYDNESGIRAIYVNGYEFDNITDGTLSIRLQQFDAAYESFTIQAEDNAGNMSDVYRTENPYFSDEDAAGTLPESAEPTGSTSATADVTEHVMTDNGEDTEGGKEFYTIQTANEKVFYLIIDRDGDNETVYFLTEISENDLLNATSDNSETLPKNSAAVDSAIPVSNAAISDNNGEETVETGETETTEDAMGENAEDEETAKKENPVFAYIIIGIAGTAVAVFVTFMKKKKKKEDFIEEDEDDDDDEEYDTDDDDLDNDTDDFFENSGDDE